MKMIFGTLLLSASGLLSGCDQLGKELATLYPNDPVTIVFSPGYEVAIDSKPIGIYGFDTCPKADAAMERFFGPAPNAGSTDCIVITPGTKSVRVKLAFQSGLAQEEWTVRRDDRYPDRTYLTRPDGSPVVSYAEFSRRSIKKV